MWSVCTVWGVHCVRALAAYAFIACRERRAMPTAIAASTTRSISRLRIMQMVAAPSAPTRLAAGTLTSSKTSSAVGEARMPHLPPPHSEAHAAVRRVHAHAAVGSSAAGRCMHAAGVMHACRWGDACMPCVRSREGM